MSGDKIVPGVWLEVLHRERHPAVLRLDCRNHSINRLALLQYFARMLYPSRPRNVGHVHEAINALFNLDEGAKVCKVADAALHAIAHMITFRQSAPRILLHLFHAEADAASFRIDAEHFDFDRIARPDQFAWMLYPFGPAHFRNVHQAFNAWFQFDKCAVVSHARDLTRDACSGRKTLINSLPG